MASFWGELRRRNVFKVAVAYAIVGWLLIQVADILMPIFKAPDWILQVFTLLVILGFPLILLFAWAFELTPEGLKRTREVPLEQSIAHLTRRKFDFIIIGVLAAAVVFFALDKFVWVDEPTPMAAEVSEHQKSIAVLPFVNMSGDKEQDYFSDGITEELVNSLVAIDGLRVAGRTSSFTFKGKDVDLPTIGEQLNVAHILEGSVRKSGNRLRITAQLIKAADGFHVWSQTYERQLADIFDIQVEIAESIAAALGVVLNDEKREQMVAVGTRNVEAFEAFLKGRAIFDAVHRDEGGTTSLWDANEWFERAVALDPHFAAPHYMDHDAYAHFLMSSGSSPMAPADQKPDLSEEAALNRMQNDFQSALAHVKDPSLRMNIEFDGTILLNTWHQLPSLLQLLDSWAKDGKTETRVWAWTDLGLRVLGRAETSLLRAENQLKLDPLQSLSWVNAAAALLALNRPKEALEYIKQGRQVAGDHIFMNRVEAISLVLLGDVEKGAQLFMNEDSLVALGLALQGREQEARQYAIVTEQANPRQEELILAYAVLGDQAEVNRLSRAIDSSPVGSLQLLLAISHAGGRVPFNIDETPNFRAHLSEAGIDPTSLRKWGPVLSNDG